MQRLLQDALEASQQAEAQLRAREERLQVSLDAAGVGTWDWNIRTGDVRWSANLERLHGQAPGQFKGTFESFLESVHPDDRPYVVASIQRAVAEAEPYAVEYRCTGPDGGVKWFEGRGHVIRDEAGEPAWMSGICTDVTERRRLQEQLYQRQRLESLGILAGGIAHDFNNLLVAIMGNTCLATETLPSSASAVPLLNNVLSACERAALLTRQILAYSGKGSSDVRPTNLSALVEELGSLLHASIPSLVTLCLKLEDVLPPVLADETQLHQVVMNLVINGAEAIPDRTNGTVTVTTRRCQLLPDDVRSAIVPIASLANEYVELSVHDTGCGMDLATQAHIFDPFYTTKFTGRGLGLSAVLGIVSAHRGTIMLKSMPGQGSCFAVLLPAASNSDNPTE